MIQIKLQKGLSTTISDEDADLLQWTWFTVNQYVFRNNYVNGEYIKIPMHRVIGERIHQSTITGLVVDHINHDTLDNRRGNLRVVTSSENSLNRIVSPSNRSGHIGVCWAKNHQKWQAYLTVNGKPKHLGLFEHVEDAIKARQEAFTKHYGHLEVIQDSIK